jgi:D-xylose transport system substrate-binding protein
MGRVRYRSALAAGFVVALATVGAACGGSDDNTDSTTAAAPATSAAAPAASDTAAASTAAAAGGKVGVILPDSKSSVRWESFDRPLLADAFKAAGVEADIQNAEGDKNKMATIADQMITSGVKVLLIVNLDSESGAAIEKKAADAGVQTIDYDRLTLGGSAAAYISFDNVKVGTLQGEGLVKCLTDKGVEKPAVAVLNGSPTDNNATLFASGYDAVINPKFDAGEWTQVDNQSVPDWDNQKGGQIFEQMLTKAGGKVDGVLAAIALLGGGQPATTGTVRDDTGNRDVPAVLADPVAIYKDNIKLVTDDGFVAVADICTPELAAACTEAGLQ